MQLSVARIHLSSCSHQSLSRLTPTRPPNFPTEGRVFSDYQGLEVPREDVDTISNATYLKNFKDFITKAEPQWDADKKNQLFYQ